MQSTMPVTDFIGREIKVGDTLVYPVRQGSKMWLSRIRVTQVVPGESPKAHGLNNEGRRVTVAKLANAVVVQQPVDIERGER